MKKLLTILAVAVLAVGSLSAQAKTNSDIKVFGLEMGTGFNYDLAAKTSNPTQTISALFGLSDSIQAGFTTIKGDVVAHSFSMVKVIVFPLPDLGVNFGFGGDGANNIVSGFGVGYNAFRSSNTGLTTALQVYAQYLFNNPASGNLGLGLNLKLGL